MVGSGDKTIATFGLLGDQVDLNCSFVQRPVLSRFFCITAFLHDFVIFHSGWCCPQVTTSATVGDRLGHRVSFFRVTSLCAAVLSKLWAAGVDRDVGHGKTKERVSTERGQRVRIGQ